MTKNKTLIIAEAGVNHNGSISLAKEMIAVAANAKADYIKFQSYITEELLLKTAVKADYQKQNTNENETQFEMLKRYELSVEDHYELIEECKKNKIRFLSSPFDIGSINLLEKLKLKTIKIPSSEITNYPYLSLLGSLNKNVILSTGMSTLEEIESAVNLLQKKGAMDISIMHCNTEYPTPFEDVNLNVISTLKKRFKLSIGYSDHTPGIIIAPAAVAAGAEVIEKHFTLDKSLKGPDHLASLEPDELVEMVNHIRIIDKAKGSKIKFPTNSEIKNLKVARKSIYAKKYIKKGDSFNELNITTKRPGNGLCASNWDEILFKKSKFNYSKDDMIKLKEVK